MTDSIQELAPELQSTLVKAIVICNGTEGIVVAVTKTYLVLHDGRKAFATGTIIWHGQIAVDFEISENALEILSEEGLLEKWHEDYTSLEVGLIGHSCS